MVSDMANHSNINVSRTAAYSSRLAKGFHQLLEDGELTTFRILSGTQSFECHKSILSSVSDVLKAMIKTDMTEASTGEVRLDNIPPSVVKLLLDYVYTGETVIPPDQLLGMATASDYLQLLELKDHCLDQALTVINPSNVISWYKFVESQDREGLKTRCSEILSSSFDDVAKSEDFRELTFAELSSCIRELHESDVNPDHLLEAVFSWIDHRPSDRCNNIDDSLQIIHLPQCSPVCLNEAMEKYEVIFDSCPTLYKTFSCTLAQMAVQGGARSKHYEEETVAEGKQCNKATKAKEENKKARLMFIRGCGYPPFAVWELDSAMEIKKISDISECSYWLSACPTPEGFVVTGGVDSVTCSMFIASTNTWLDLKSLQNARYHHASLFLHHKIFVFGGIVSNRGTSSSVQSLDLNGGEWKEEPDLLSRVGNPEMASMETTIYMLDTDRDELLSLDADDERNTWVRKQKLGVKCSGARMIAYCEDLLIAGGYYKLFVCYNPSKDTWSTVKAPTLVHRCGALVLHGEKLYLIGGEEERAEEYSFDTDSWSVSKIRAPTKQANLYAVSLHASIEGIC